MVPYFGLNHLAFIYQTATCYEMATIGESSALRLWNFSIKILCMLCEAEVIQYRASGQHDVQIAGEHI